MRSAKVTCLMAVMAVFLGGCTAVITQDSFFPRAALKAPDAVLQVPEGYLATNRTLMLDDLGAVRVVRLDNPNSDAAIIYSAGNGGFVDSPSTSRIAAHFAALTGADIILYDYPGRGGTTIAPTIDASLATGPAMLGEMRRLGWIGKGPLYAYGLSFGGSMAAAMVREGGFAGLIIEGSASNIQKIGRDLVPTLLKPFVGIRVAEDLQRFDYLGYAVRGKTRILLLSGKDDKVIRPKRMRQFGEDLKKSGATVSFIAVPGGHGGALDTEQGRAAFKNFVTQNSR